MAAEVFDGTSKPLVDQVTVGGKSAHIQSVKLSDASGATVNPAAPVVAAGENHIGQVGGEGDLIEVTLSLDTNAYSDGDVLAATQVVANALRKIDGTGVLQSLVIVDADDQGVGMDLIFLRANVSVGSENSAPGPADADFDSAYLGKVAVSASDYTDWGGVRTATLRNVGLFLKSVSASRDLYLAAVVRGGTPTYTASGLKVKLGILWN